MENTPKDLLDYLEETRRSGKYNMIIDAEKVVRGYVDKPGSMEGLRYLYPTLGTLDVDRYADALEHINKK